VINRRFPKSKYLRQLAAMQHDLQDWKLEYNDFARNHPDDWIGSRFADRAAILNEAIEMVVQLRDKLYEVPRLS
jgi:hypothetical protein